MNKKQAIIWMLILLPFCLFAQTDARAAKVLDKVLANMSESSGIQIHFKGTENGVLLLKGERFHFNNGNIYSWYDGKTQWSYVTDTEEVNISNPTPEELQAINPYLILMRYKTDYNYTYQGNQTRNGLKGHEIILMPKQSGNQEVIRVFVSTTNQPLGMKIERNGKAISEIHVTAYQTDQNFTEETFRFNKAQYPHAEVIDLR